MVHRIALITGAAAAAGILVLALGVGGMFARSPSTADAATMAAGAAPTAQTQVETVYVKPAPPQRVIHVTQTSPPTARQAPRTVIVHRTSHGGGGDDGGNDGGDD